MNYKIFFENNKASRCEPVKEINDNTDYAMINTSVSLNHLSLMPQMKKMH